MIDLGISLKPQEGPALLDEADRFKHLAIFGGTGSGKTTYLLNLIAQEIDNPIIILDPNGSLASQAARLPFDPKRLIYVDIDHPISLNPLKVNRNKSSLANELLELINAVITSLNPEQMSLTAQMDRILTNAVKDLAELTISNLTHLMDYEDHRRKILTEYWQRFDEKNKAGYYVNREQVESAKRISARLSVLIEDENIKPFIREQNDFNIPNIIRDKGIVIFDLSGFDTKAATYLGCLVAFQVKNYYLTSKGTDPLYFYVDEFHRFFTRDFDRLLTEARRFKVSVNMATHGLAMIDKKLAEIIKTNTLVKVILSANSDDAERLAQDMRLTVKDLLSIENNSAYLSIGKSPHYVLCFPPPELGEFPELKPAQRQIKMLRDGWFAC